MSLRPTVVIVLAVAASASLLSASDLSRYREFHLGAPIADVAKQAGMESSEARLISSRPERIQELAWRTNRSASGSASDNARPDSVREIRFGFYNGSLFEMMVAYDRDQTSGLTNKDMTEALSAVYGPGSAPVTKEMAFNAGYNTTVHVIAQWSDAENLLSLVGFSDGGGFGAIVSSKANETLARQAIAESDRLDRVEAPQRAMNERAKQVADAEARDEKSRLLNKPGFRP
jgi:hypothetical protein